MEHAFLFDSLKPECSQYDFTNNFSTITHDIIIITIFLRLNGKNYQINIQFLTLLQALCS